MKGGGASVALEQVTIAPDESEKYLKMAYDEEFPKEGLDESISRKLRPPRTRRPRAECFAPLTRRIFSACFSWI